MSASNPMVRRRPRPAHRPLAWSKENEAEYPELDICHHQFVLGAAGAFLALAAAWTPECAHASAEAIFSFQCAGCHIGGGNIIGGSTLKIADLERNGMLDTDALYKIIYEGKGRMPGFGAECTPQAQCTFSKRLADEDVQGLAEFTLKKAKEGW